MTDLTQRQIDILQAIIKEYTETGEPVGSDILEKKFKLGVSPATIRNEMVELAKKGYLKKTHFSSGRVPSSEGFRFYVKNLMKEKELSTTDEVAYKNSVWDDKDDSHKLLSNAARILAQKTGLLSLVTTNDGDIYYSGVGNLLAIHEFLDWDLSRSVFNKLDEIDLWEKILGKIDQLNENVVFMLSQQDFSDPIFDQCASIFSEFEGDKLKGMIGVVGPKRMYYEIVTPQVKYFSNLLEEIIKEHKM